MCTFFGVLLGLGLFAILGIVGSRRRRKEIRFWRWAFVTTSDNAYKQFKDLRHYVEMLVESGAIDATHGARISEILKEQCEQTYTRGTPTYDRFGSHVDFVAQTCVENRFQWVTVKDTWSFLVNG